MVDIMKLSRAIKSMEQLSTMLCDSQLYRDGDVQLMMNRIHQLEQQLPMQHMLVQVPIENTLGGYQMFNNGVTDLAPELHGWYGAPGIALRSKQPAPAAAGCLTCSAKSTTSGGGRGQQHRRWEHNAGQGMNQSITNCSNDNTASNTTSGNTGSMDATVGTSTGDTTGKFPCRQPRVRL